MVTENLAMHAVLQRASAAAKPTGGKSYKLVFSYPRGYIGHVDDLMDLKVDVFWNEELIARSAHIKAASTKPVRDSDPLYLVTLDCDALDSGLANAIDLVDTAGDLRFFLTQIPAFAST